MTFNLYNSFICSSSDVGFVEDRAREEERDVLPIEEVCHKGIGNLEVDLDPVLNLDFVYVFIKVYLFLKVIVVQLNIGSCIEMLESVFSFRVQLILLVVCFGSK